MKNTARRGKSGNSRFTSIPSVDIPRSAFNRSHGHKTTLDAGFLVPIMWDEALPGDTMSVRTNTFARMATPLKPVMDNQYLDLFFFFVPLRLIWDNFQAFMGERKPNPDSSIDFLTPKSTADNSIYVSQSLQDYLGLPPLSGSYEHNVFPLRAYNLIYNEWFRDENLQDGVVVDLDDGPDDPADYSLLRRGKRKDYFTSALPFAQKGDPVELPLGGQAALGGFTTGFVGTGAPTFSNQSGANVSAFLGQAGGNPDLVEFGNNSTNGAAFEWVDPQLLLAGTGSGLYADLTTATAATINSIREAFQIQRLLERDARGGTRYTEIIRAHFGVTSDDSRLQRPEYLGGGSSMINIHPVAQTSNNDTQTSPQGNLSAYATGGGNSQGFNKSFTEHGVVLGIACIRADLTYQQGLNRAWSRSTRFDYYWPAFQALGEQELLSKEIFVDGSGSDDDVFGYQERYAEYRYSPSRISGKFRSSDPQSLDVWHLAQDFATRPELNASFIVENPPVDRVIAVPSEPQFLLDCWFNINHVRPMPVYSVPGLVDHF